MGIAAVAVVAGLALGACSSGSGGDAEKTPTPGATGSGQASATDSGGTPATTSASPTVTATVTAGATATSTTPGDDHSVEGVWLATQDGTKVQLVLGKGKAGLTSTSLCGGSYTEHNGLGLDLTCMDGNKDRTSGHGELAADGKTLTVSWTGGLTDTFARTGLPSS
ncbi:hypothetical protein V2S66_26190 [Streptomyces sp. V4-01]|uniref:Lipoprotein n=1 Tax=Actinacidiphila polyblastidii TaxID=3110430 RepID=A0ABU7PI00_9ACTN|nr:hypothetical protein [Streptomyces sp. V4-01]